MQDRRNLSGRQLYFKIFFCLPLCEPFTAHFEGGDKMRLLSLHCRNFKLLNVSVPEVKFSAAQVLVPSLIVSLYTGCSRKM